MKICNVLITVVFLLAACQKQAPEPDPLLDLSIGELEIDNDSTRFSFTITSNTEWRFDCDQQWLNPDRKEGMGDCEVWVELSDNLSNEKREATIIITASAISGATVTRTAKITHLGVVLALDQSYVSLNRDGNPMTVQITSRIPWRLNEEQIPWWCSITPTSGNGDDVISIIPIEIIERRPRGPDNIDIYYGNSGKAILTIRQEQENEDPDKPVIISPADGDEDVSLTPLFEWNQSSDPDGDEVFYRVWLQGQNKNWEMIDEDLTDLSLSLTDPLQGSRQYRWKVTAYDHYGGSADSDVGTFKTRIGPYYNNYESRIAQWESADAAQPAHLVFVGDGFVPDDFETDGVFDGYVNRAMDALFSTEPYASYREYFRVHKLAVFSKESGATVEYSVPGGPPAMTRKTAFSTTFTGGGDTYAKCDFTGVLNTVRGNISLSEEDLRNSAIVLIVNLDIYAGVTGTLTTGETIAICPVSNYDFEYLVVHEGGGHAFGRLSDEFTEGLSPFPANLKQYIIDLRCGNVWNKAGNLSFEADPDQAHWSHYYDLQGYEQVGHLEGGGGYAYDVWHSEPTSCMMENSVDFNAVSREAIVRRIMNAAQQDFCFEEFLVKDNPEPAKIRSLSSPQRRLPQPVVIW